MPEDRFKQAYVTVVYLRGKATMNDLRKCSSKDNNEEYEEVIYSFTCVILLCVHIASADTFHTSF